MVKTIGRSGSLSHSSDSEDDSTENGAEPVGDGAGDAGRSRGLTTKTTSAHSSVPGSAERATPFDGASSAPSTSASSCPSEEGAVISDSTEPDRDGGGVDSSSASRCWTTTTSRLPLGTANLEPDGSHDSRSRQKPVKGFVVVWNTTCQLCPRPS